MQKKVKKNPQKIPKTKSQKKKKLSELIIDGSIPSMSRRPPFSFVVSDYDKKEKRVTEHNKGEETLEKIRLEAKKKLAKKTYSSLFVKNIVLSKDMSNGDWIVSLLDTNKGEFNLGEEINTKLNQKLIRKFIIYLKSSFENDLVSFLDEEKE